MKTAVVLAGGKGLRLYPDTEDIPKPMVIVNGKPIMEYNILMLKKLKFEFVYVIVGYKKEPIIDYFKNGERYGLNINYIENKYIDEPKKSGLGDALLLVKDIIAEPFMTILGDEIYVNTKHMEMIDLFERDRMHESMIAIYETEDIGEVKKNYSVKVDDNWRVLDVEEKSTHPWNNLVGCGTYLFRRSIFEYLKKTEISARTARKELTDTLKLIIEDNKILRAFDIGGRYINITYPKDLNYAKKILEGSQWKS
jgi:NDP-sugar pyrophosphorylase family protein